MERDVPAAAAHACGVTADTIKRGVAAGRSAERGTSGAATGGGGRSAPDPDQVRLPRPVSSCVIPDPYQVASYPFDLAFGEQHAHTPNSRVEKILGETRIASKRRVPLAVQGDLADHPARGELVVARRVPTGHGVVAIRAFRPRFTLQYDGGH